MCFLFFFFQAEDGIRDRTVTGVQTCALPISPKVEQAAAFSIPLLLATALLLQVQKRVLGRRGYAAVGGKGGQRRTIPLGARSEERRVGKECRSRRRARR